MEKQFENSSKKLEAMREKLHKQAELHMERVSALEAKMSKVNSENVELKQKYDEVRLLLMLNVKGFYTSKHIF